MAQYTYRYQDSAGNVIATAFAECGTDGEAIKKGKSGTEHPYAHMEVWRGELVYRGTGRGHSFRPVKVERYRNKADELRTIAEEWSGRETRMILLRLAADYDRMADTA